MTRASTLALLLSGCVARAPAHAAPAPTLTVATYNLNYGIAGDPATMATLASSEADVLLLQEVSPAWRRALRRELAARWPHRCVARSEWPAGGAAILSREPLRACARSSSPVGFFPAIAATVDTAVGSVRVVGIHLRPARAGLGVLEDLPELPSDHRAELAAHLAALVDPALPTVFAGDFNEGDGEGAVGELATRGYASALAENAPDAATWRWPLLLMSIEKRLDHVLYDPRRLRCVDARVLRGGRSDHFAVVARFAPTPTRPSTSRVSSGLHSNGVAIRGRSIGAWLPQIE
ncbi:MAG: endonuclease/exonuclease/phosphatase family protein [Sandaracinaceae bacterium]|nr:endonuclease/exonuclease/phosphatase family protein [Sandaracinaceae bacterium]